LPKLTDCVKIFEDTTGEREKEGLPKTYLCSGFMNRVYLRGPRDGDKQIQAYEPFGWYCKRCGMFVTDADYPELEKKRKVRYYQRGY
jgi:hypothetical protein